MTMRGFTPPSITMHFLSLVFWRVSGASGGHPSARSLGPVLHRHNVQPQSAGEDAWTRLHQYELPLLSLNPHTAGRKLYWDLAILYIKAKSNSVLFSFDAVLCSYWPPFEKHQTMSHHRSPNFSGIFKCQLRLLSLLFHTGWISDSILPPMIWCGIAP